MSKIYDHLFRQIRGFVVERREGQFILQCTHCVVEFTTIELFAMHVKKKHGDAVSSTGEIETQIGLLNEREIVSYRREESARYISSTQMRSSPNNEIHGQDGETNTSADHRIGEQYTPTRREHSLKEMRGNPCAEEGTSFREESPKPRTNVNDRERPSNERESFQFAVPAVPANRFTAVNQVPKKAEVKPKVKGKIFRCEKCTRQYDNANELKKHVSLRHPKTTRFSCEHCHKSFANIQTRKLHIRSMHILQRPFMCLVCPSTFKRRPELEEHTKVQHSKDQKVVKCDLCGSRFRSAFEKKNHDCSSPTEVENFLSRLMPERKRTKH